jgi:hypothetical protein
MEGYREDIASLTRRMEEQMAYDGEQGFAEQERTPYYTPSRLSMIAGQVADPQASRLYVTTLRNTTMSKLVWHPQVPAPSVVLLTSR